MWQRTLSLKVLYKLALNSKPIYLTYYSTTLFKYSILECEIIRSRDPTKDLKIDDNAQLNLPEKQAMMVAAKQVAKSLRKLKEYSRQDTSNLASLDDKAFPLVENLVQSVEKWLDVLPTLGTSEQQSELVWIARLLTNLNILNPSLWKALVKLTMKHQEQMVHDSTNATNELMPHFLSQLTRYFKLFRSEGYESRQKKILVKEIEISSIINEEFIISLFKSIDQACANLENQGKSSQINVQSLFKMYWNLHQICIKYARVDSLNLTKLKEFTKLPLRILSQAQLENKTFPLIYQFFVYFEIEEATLKNQLAQKLNEYLKEQFVFQEDKPVTSEQEHFMIVLLDSWRTHRNYFDENVFKVLKPFFIKLASQIEPQYFYSFAFNIATARINDHELAQHLVSRLEILQPEKLKLTDKKLTHLFLRLVQLQFSNLDLSKLNLLIAQSNNFCLSMRGLPPNQSPTCFQDSLSKVQTRTNQEHPNKGRPESIIVEALTQYLKANLDVEEQVTIQSDYKYCLFEVDLALLFKTDNVRIAIEVCGEFYGIGTGNVIGKKKNKFDLMELDGWKIIYISTPELFNQTAVIQSDKTSQLVLDTVVKIESLLGRNLKRKPQK